MKKDDLFYLSRDGKTQVHAVRWTPDSENVVAVVQIVHGMAEYVERYEEFAEFLTARGYVVVGNDHLGHGKSISDNGTYGYFCEKDSATVVVRDVHRLKKMTQEQYPGVPYFIFGHSMGSYITRNYMARYGTGIDGVIVAGTGDEPGVVLVSGKAVATVTGLFKGDTAKGKFIDQTAFGAYNKRIKDARTPVDWLTSVEEKVDAYIADEACGFMFTANGFKTLFELIARTKKKEYMKCIPKELPVYIIAGKDDPVGAYGVAVEGVYKRYKELGMTDVEMKLYPDARHELLNEAVRENVMEDIAAWLSNHLVISGVV